MDKIKKGKEKQMENKKLFNKNVDEIEKELLQMGYQNIISFRTLLEIEI